MDFDGAIRAHSEWKMKLSAYIHKPDGSLKASQICQDNKCALGQWIYGEGTKYTTLQEYAALKTEHATFHKEAGDIVRKADSGQNMTDEIALGGKSGFATASSKVVSAIMAMKRKT